MKEGWKYKPFGEVFPIKMGKTPPRGDKSCWDTKKESENKWVSISDISQNEGKVIFDTKEYITDAAAEKIFRVKANSLLMSFKLTIGKMAFAGTDLYTNEAIIAIPENKEYNLKFLYFYLSSYNWSSLTDGNEKVKGKTLNKESIGRIQLPIISLPDQQRIVSYLDAEFAKIEALKANAEKQLQAAKDLFQAALKELLTPKDGWKEKKLGEIGTFTRGGNFTKSDFVPKGIPCIHYGQIHMHFGVVTENCLTYLPNDFPKLKFAQKGDLIIAITSEDNEGSCKCTAWLGSEDVAVGGHIAVFHHQLDPVFMSYFFMSPSFQNDKLAYTHGFKVVEIKPSDIAKIDISYPQLNEQKRIVARLDALSANVKALQTNYAETITLCNDLKQALLKKVFG